MKESREASPLDDLFFDIKNNSCCIRDKFSGLFVYAVDRKTIRLCEEEIEDLRKMANTKFSDRNSFDLLQRLERVEADRDELKNELENNNKILDDNNATIMGYDLNEERLIEKCGQLKRELESANEKIESVVKGSQLWAFENLEIGKKLVNAVSDLEKMKDGDAERLYSDGKNLIDSYQGGSLQEQIIFTNRFVSALRLHEEKIKSFRSV